MGDRRRTNFGSSPGSMAVAVTATVLVSLPVPSRAQAPDTIHSPLTVSASIGHSFLQLPSTSFIFLEDDTGADEITVFKFENHDGELNGARIDASIDGIARWKGRTLGLKGFYSEVDGSQTVFCDDPVSGDVDCGWMLLFDPDPNNDDKNAAGNTLARTTREARHWGVAAEAKRARPGAVTLKSGLAFKAIDQQLRLRAADDEVPAETLDYREELDTHYWGAYVGIVTERRLFNRVTLRVDGEAGLYYARTEYEGRFNQLVGIAQSQTLSLSRDDAAVVAALKVEIEKNFGRFMVSAYGQGEWYSYAPEMAYNDTDRQPGLQTGFVDGTRIDSGDAYALTFGARASMLLGPGAPASDVAGWFSGSPGGYGPSGPPPTGISVSVGHSFLQLPSMSFIFLEDDTGTTEDTVAKFENHDGELNGTRIDASIDGIARWNGRALSLKGFYSEVDGSRTVFCDEPATGDVDCGWMFLFDPDPTINDKNTVNDTLARTKREARHWGVAAEVQKARPGAVTLKSGLAFKAIDQRLQLQAAEVGNSPDTLDYREELDSHYWGAYVGFVTEQRLFNSVMLRVDGEAGLYYARTDYEGRFNEDLGSSTGSQILSLSRDDTAVAASLKVEIEKNFGRFMVSVFGQGEWYSFAPEMAYNDTDRETGLLNAGLVDGTRIEGGDAYALTAGARVSIPLGSIPQ